MNSIQDRITSLLSADDYRPVVPQELAQTLRLTKKELHEFRVALESLNSAGVIRADKKGRIRLKPSSGFIAGVVRKISSGAAFVIPSERPPELRGGDIFISARDLRDAQTGDEVLVRLSGARRSGGQRSGVIEKILERASNVFVGTYGEEGGQGFVKVDGTVFADLIHVGDPGAKGARPNDKVVIEMLRFPTASRMGEAVLTKVLGQRGDPGVDTVSVIYSMALPFEFSEEVLDDARGQAELFEEVVPADRLDLTGETIITIDPVDARDFDDAISLTKSEDGHWHLGVHIADVAHFVPPGSPLDREAVLRGTSVYLPHHVIPMLPEVISNGLASLQQGQLRFTKTVLLEFDAAGAVLGADVRNSAIRVARRFAYEEVMPLIRNPRQAARGVTPHVRHLLERMFELAMILRKRRFDGGALQMGAPEIEIDFDSDGQVVGAHQRHHDESHEIIEEFMLAANIAVARLLASRNLAFLRRAHGDPDELKLRNFQEFVRGLGYELEQYQSRAEIQQLIHDVRGRPEERAINFALLRSMKQAEYTPEQCGHYALAESDYCHFTSPIRRYPDLTIHRLIGEIAAGRRPRPDSMPNLLEQGKHCSATERRAERAERELIRVRLLRYMAGHVGEEMDAIITGVENFGLFCQGIEIPAEGLIHTSALTDDFYEFDPVARTLTGQRHKRQFRLGSPIRVTIAAVDIDRRQLDLRVTEAETTRPTGPARSPRQPVARNSDDAQPADSGRARATHRNSGRGRGVTDGTGSAAGEVQRPSRTRGKGKSGNGRAARKKRGRKK